MADRFPSLDELDGDAAALTSTNDGPTNELSFLEREKAVLPEGTFGDIDGDEDYDPEASKFEHDFPDVLAPANLSIGGTITDKPGPFVPGAPSTLPMATSGAGMTSSFADVNADFDDDGPEPEIIKEWRRRRDEGIAHRDAVSAEKKAKTVEDAKKAIDDFYDNYNDTKGRNVKKTRAEAEKFLESRDDTTAGGTSWDRIAKLVDLTGTGARGGGPESGKHRFRELLKGLTKDPDAPGASGV